MADENKTESRQLSPQEEALGAKAAADKAAAEKEASTRAGLEKKSKEAGGLRVYSVRSPTVCRGTVVDVGENVTALDFTDGQKAIDDLVARGVLAKA